MTEEKTPPAGTRILPRPERPAPLPTILTVHNLLMGLAGQVGGARDDLDRMELTLADVLRRLPATVSSVPPSEVPSEVLLMPKLPSPDSLSPSSRPSMAAKAGKAVKDGGGKAGKGLVTAAGALMLVGQAISFFGRPELGPAVTSIKVIGGALLELARSLGGAP